MQTRRLSTGKRIRWEQRSYEVKRLLPDRQVVLEDLQSGETQVVSEDTLVNALFAGALTFELPLNPKQKKTASRSEAVSSIVLPDYPEPAKAAAELRHTILQPILALPSHERTEARLRAYDEEVRQAAAAQG